MKREAVARPLIFEIGSPESRCVEAPTLDVPDIDMAATLGSGARSRAVRLPHVTEIEIARHYQHLASVNFGVDSGFYPLGSCTMKYNPRIDEWACRLPGFSAIHPYQPAESVQGALGLMHGLQDALGEISGLPAVSLQPAAGAHGELTALMAIRAYHVANGDARKRVIIPDTAHGTNPATVAMCGYSVTQVPSNDRGGVDLEALKAALDTDVAALMLTNPNTLGLFDENIVAITDMVHAVGALAFCDGANLNAILGKVRPGDMGFDAMHINLHKTFATPHGGGGPGAGPVCVTDALAEFLPGPVVVKDADGSFALATPARSIGRIKAFLGNFGVLVRAYTYIRALGAEGITEVSEQAVLSANYVKERLRGAFDLAYDRTCMHEFVLSGERQRKQHGVRTLDMAKRLLDHGVHPPTVYFPLLVHEAIMIEPTETESLEVLDEFVDAMLAIAREVEENPEMLHEAPYTTPVRRLDEAAAVKQPDLAWKPAE
ncbi:MAG: glycine dehydrogenase (aminomethyl-transferring) [Actinobacteria bacterium HGW-Actinobacteria-1]|jgi:glycine dehydrogenase subunit 2|nr:MAG: glycine dehydrogenase (aminomethyl-transferring) [Actinobacteria bacterium HGW-Actinobacteria-1]